MTIYTAATRTATFWKKEELSFKDLIDRLSSPQVSGETMKEYLGLSRDEQDSLKDIGGYVGGRLRGGKRTKNSIVNRSLVVLDADNVGGGEGLDRIKDVLEQLGYSYFWHTTRKHTPESPRVRIIFPLAKAIPPEYYEPIVRGLCNYFGMDVFDKTCVEANRLMYYPSVCSDGEFLCGSRIDGKILNGEEFLAQYYLNWKNVDEWPKFKSEESIVKSDKKILSDPREKEGPIGTFCRAYNIHEAIEKFLPDVYVPGDTPDRYTYVAGTASNGLVVYDDVFAYAYNQTDPATTGHLQNAYDLVRTHLFGDSGNSTDKMFALMQKDEGFREQQTEDALEAFGEVEDDKKEALKELERALDRDKHGRMLTTIDNYYKILTMNPYLCDCYYFDVFANKKMVVAPLPWYNPEETLPRLWSDNDDSNLRHYIEKSYASRNNTILVDALNKAFYEKMVHPVREYLNSLTWDGVRRVDTLLIDYFGAEDTVYTREAIAKTLLAAVARVYRPGTKFDNVLILKGKQGTGKSTFVRILASDKWFSDSLTRFDGKEASELLESKWLIELGELKGLYRKEIEQAKQFFSKTSDQYRAAYARHPEEHPRQCVFIGTTNNETFLTDRTGNRRFWPVGLGTTAPTKDVFKELALERDQIWAEVKARYDSLTADDPEGLKLGEALILTDEARKLAEIEQENRLEDDPRIGEIISFICTEVPLDWDKWTLKERLNYWENEHLRDPDTELRRRNRICAAEISKELYGFKVPDRKFSSEINTIMQNLEGLERDSGSRRYGKPYKQQKGFTITQEFYDTYLDDDKGR